MGLVHKIKLAILFIISLVIMAPLWYSFLDKTNKKLAIEKFNSNKYTIYNHVIVTGNALFNFACRHEELQNDTLYNVTYYVPFVDSLWTIDKPIKTVIEFESGKMAFEDGFLDAVKKLDLEMDSLSKLSTNRVTLIGNNKTFDIPKFENSVDAYFKDSLHLNVNSRFTISKIIINEHFSMFGFIFMSILTFLIGVFLYFYALQKLKRKNYS